MNTSTYRNGHMIRTVRAVPEVTHDLRPDLEPDESDRELARKALGGLPDDDPELADLYDADKAPPRERAPAQIKRPAPARHSLRFGFNGWCTVRGCPEFADKPDGLCPACRAKKEIGHGRRNRP